MASEPPDHLGAEARQLWLDVSAEHRLEAHHLTLLDAACDALDRMLAARAEVLRDGLTVNDSRGGVKAHPAVAIERDSRIALARLLRQLDLDESTPTTVYRR